MDILFYSYESSFETPLTSIFSSLGLTLHFEKVSFEEKGTCSGETVQKIGNRILDQRETGNPFLFVFSINFFPAISEICEKLNTIYVSWTVDNPVMELFTNSIKNSHNRIFMFDKAQYQRLNKYNPANIFHLPLGADSEIFDNAISSISEKDRATFSHDICFVGSLYEKSSGLYSLKLDDFTNGYIDGLINSQLMVYGYNFLEETLSKKVIEAVKGSAVNNSPADFVEPIDAYTVSQFLISKKIAEIERHHLLNELGKRFSVDLYTNSDTSRLTNVFFHPPIGNYTDVPKVYNLSKINLNFTLRSIEKGLPLRIFEVLASGGFLISNYQEEIPELFEIGEEIEIFTCEEELYDKCEYYLSHEEERKAIAKKGYEKIKSCHTLQSRIKQIISNIY